ncbi:MAG TPA: hypothetical protein PKW90_05715, partial [Myxococcota bacterium]|nr:hypothetical protein [Myxococcota bacterium]
ELGTLAMEVAAWEGLAEPLEEEGAWGLTPIGTGLVHGPAMDRWREAENPTVSHLEQLRYVEEDLPALRRFLSPFDIPKKLSPLEERELWLLLGSWSSLFLTASAA